MSGFDSFMQSRDPRMKVRSIAASAGIPEDVADDFSNVTGGIESGNNHYDKRGRVKMSPVDPKDGQRAYGFSQIKPGTAKKHGFTEQDLLDENKNIEAGLREFYSIDRSDPVARRIGYFSGSGSRALKQYRRTGQIPQGGDFTGTSFQKYIDSTMPRGESLPTRMRNKVAASLSSGRFDSFMSNRASDASNQPVEAPNQAPESSLPPEATTRPRIAPYATTSDGEVRGDEFAPAPKAYAQEQEKFNQVDTVGQQAVEANRLNRIIARRARREQQRQIRGQQKQANAMRNIEAQGVPSELPDNPSLADLSQAADRATSQNNQVTSLGELQRREGRFGQSRTVGVGELRQADNKVIQARDELYKSIGGLRARDEAGAQQTKDAHDALVNQVRQQVLDEQRNQLNDPNFQAQQARLGVGYSMPQDAVEQEVDKRVNEIENQQRRDMLARASYTPEERKTIQSYVKDVGQYGDTQRGLTTGFNRFLAGIDRLAAGASGYVADLNIPGAKEYEQGRRKDAVASLDQAQAIEEQYPLGWKGKTASFAAENIPNVLPVAASTALTGGNPIGGFALYNALLARGEGKAPSEIIRDTAKGAATGAVFQVGGKFSLVPRVATVGLGTSAVEKAFGASDRDTLGASVTNALFAAFSGSDSIQARLGAKVRVWWNGKPVADVENTRRGVRLISPSPAAADANVEAAGKAGDGSFKYKLLNAAPTERQGETISTPIPQPPKSSPETSVSEQVQAMRTGTQDAVLVPDGQQTPPLMPDETVTKTDIGTIVHPKEIKPRDIRRAIRTNTIDSLIQAQASPQSAPSKPDTATRESIVPPLAPVPDALTKESDEEVAQLRQERINRQRESWRRATESPDPKSAAAIATIAAAQEHIRALEAGEHDEALRQTIVSRRNASIAQRVLDGENVSAEERAQASDEIERQLNKAEENMAQMAPADIRNTLRLSPSDWNGLVDEVLAADSPTQVAAIIRARERGTNGLDLPDVEWLHNLWKLNRAGRDIRGILEAARPKGTPKAESATAAAPRTVSHPDPEIDGKPIVAETKDGKVVVANENNQFGVSVVKNRRGINVPDLPKTQEQNGEAANVASAAEVTNAVAPENISDTRALRRNFRAGTNDATMEFASDVQRDLYDLAANEKYKMRGGQNKTSQRKVRNSDELKSSLSQRLGVSDAEVLNRAYQTYDDVRAQMKGVQHLEERRLVDNTSPEGNAVVPESVKEPYQMTRQEWRNQQFNEDEHRYLPSDYFHNDPTDYVKSENYPTPVGTIGGYEIRQKSGGGALGVFLDGKPVGYADGGTFYVKPKHQRRGIGTALLRQIREADPNHRVGNQTAAGSALMMSFHHDAVRRALAEGKPVPPEVLADYPDLAQKASAPLSKQEPATGNKIVPQAEATFSRIKELVGNSLSEHVFDVDNGGKIVARTKVTTRHGLVATKYLHVNVIQPDGNWEKWREQPNGSFKSVDSGSLGSLRDEYRPESAKISTSLSKQERAQQAKPLRGKAARDEAYRQAGEGIRESVERARADGRDEVYILPQSSVEINGKTHLINNSYLIKDAGLERGSSVNKYRIPHAEPPRVIDASPEFKERKELSRERGAKYEGAEQRQNEREASELSKARVAVEEAKTKGEKVDEDWIRDRFNVSPEGAKSLLEPAHHSARQLRRVRNTTKGKAGQFKKGVESEPQAGKFSSFMESSQPDESLPIWKRAKLSDTPLRDRQSDVETERGRIIHEPPESFTKGDAIRTARKAADERDTDVLHSAAWHGSPHSFGKFDISKIGVGEGAQVYGHGLYFAEKKEVADYYRHLGNRILVDGEEVRPSKFSPESDSPQKWAKILLANAHGNTPADVISGAIHANKQWLDPKRLDYARFKQAEGILREWEKHGAVRVENKSYLYHVELAPEEDEYLLWDKPMGEQSEKVKASLRDLTDVTHHKDYRQKISELDLGGHGKLWDYSDDSVGLSFKTRAEAEAFAEKARTKDGDEVYRALSDKLGSDKEASAYLHSLGIRGIKYLDGSSRGQGEGSYNYVIFNDEDVSITAVLSKSAQNKAQEFNRVFQLDAHQLAKGAEFISKPRRIYVNPEAQEIIAALDESTQFEGINVSKPRSVSLATQLYNVARQVDRADGQKLRALARAIRYNASTYGTANIITVFGRGSFAERAAIAHEEIHRWQLALGSDAINTNLTELDAYKQIQPFLDKSGTNENTYVRLYEAFAHLATEDSSKVGVSEDAAVEFITKYAESVKANKGVKALEELKYARGKARTIKEMVAGGREAGRRVQRVSADRRERRNGSSSSLSKEIDSRESQALLSSADETARSPIRWVGGKRQFLPVIKRLFGPYKDKRLVEPFFGSGTVSFGLQPTKALVNDYNSTLANFHKRVSEGMEYDLPYKATPEDFKQARERYNELIRQGETQTAEAAKLFYYLNQTAHGGLYRVNGKGEFNVSFQADKINRPIRPLSNYQEQYKGIKVQSGDFEKLKIKDNDFIYSDPPYDTPAIYQAGGFSWPDQIRHADWLSKQSVPVVTQNEATPRILDLYQSKGFNVWRIPARRAISRDASNRGVGSATEMIAFKNIPSRQIRKALRDTGATKYEPASVLHSPVVGGLTPLERQKLSEGNKTRPVLTKPRPDASKAEAMFERAAREKRGEAGFFNPTIFPKLAVEVANLPRALMTSFDLSAPLRQGAIFTLTEPRLAMRALRRMFQSISSKSYGKFKRDLDIHPLIELAEASGLHLSSLAGDKLSGKEEAYMTHFAEIIPGLKQSEQAYVTYLDSIRMDAFTKYTKEMVQAGVKDEESYQAIARFINAATGRGDLGQTLNSAAPILNTVFFSPRYLASRIQLLNPIEYMKMPKAARNIAFRKMFEFAAIIGLTLLLAKLAGAEVNLTDPDSPDWLKIKIGNTRYDVLAGFQQPLRFAIRLAKSFYNRAQGKSQSESQKPLSIIGKFVRSKENPSASLIHDYVSGQDFTGKPFQWLPSTSDEGFSFSELPSSLQSGRFKGGAFGTRVSPMIAQDAYDGYVDAGGKGVAKALPATMFGVGVQTYDESQSGSSRSSRREARRANRSR